MIFRVIETEKAGTKSEFKKVVLLLTGENS